MTNAWMTESQIEQLGELLSQHIHPEKTISLLRMGKGLGVCVSVHGGLAMKQHSELYLIDPDGSVLEM